MEPTRCLLLHQQGRCLLPGQAILATQCFLFRLRLEDLPALVVYFGFTHLLLVTVEQLHAGVTFRHDFSHEFALYVLRLDDLALGEFTLQVRNLLPQDGLELIVTDCVFDYRNGVVEQL